MNAPDLKSRPPRPAATPDRVAVCGDCERRTDDPAVIACTDPHCPIRMRRAA